MKITRREIWALRAGDEEVPICVPELSLNLHGPHEIWHCGAKTVAWVVFCELSP